MFRRLPMFQALTFATLVGVFMLTSVLTAEEPKPTTPASGPVTDPGTGIKRSQEENLKLFKRFSEEVLRLAQKWEKSDNAEDKERAKSLRAALKLIEEKGVEKLFKELIEGLNQKNLTGGDFNTLLGKDKKLMEALEQILAVLETENEMELLRKQIEDLKKAIEAVSKLKRDQENLRARTDNPKSDGNKLGKDQNKLAKETDAVGKALDKNNQGNQGNAGNGGKQDPKAEPKPEAKPGENTGEQKTDTGENKSDSKGDGMGGMGQPNASDPKPGDGMGKPMGGDKPTDPKAGGDPKGGDPKGGDPKPGNPMGDPMKPPSDAKPQGGEGKPQGAGKGDGKPSAGQPGGEGKPMGGDGMGMPGMGQPQPGGSKGGGQSGGGQPQPNKPKDPAAENVQQAVPQQQGAEEDIKKGDNAGASKKQDEAIKKLEEALQELEKRLKQLREKELAKLLQNLEERVNRMLRMQIEVQAQTQAIDKTVKALGGKPAVAEIQKSQAEADKESQIIGEAEKALKLMEGEGSAVVFAGILGQAKGDMESVQKRLNQARVGEDTQQIEQDVIDQLKMMLEALKKAKQELENKPSDPKPGEPPPPGKQKLIDLLNELKLLKLQQEQLNKRTIMYNKQDPGEQAKDPLVQAELKQLAERQKFLQEMIHKIATQANQ